MRRGLRSNGSGSEGITVSAQGPRSETRLRKAHARPVAIVAIANDALGSLFAATLHEVGYRVLRAKNGRELFWGYLVHEQQGGVDAVVAELHLPEPAVLDVAEAWTSAGDHPRIVIVGDGTPAERSRADRMGARIVRAPWAVPLIRSWGSESAPRAEEMGAIG